MRSHTRRDKVDRKKSGWLDYWENGREKRKTTNLCGPINFEISYKTRKENASKVNQTSSGKSGFC